MTDSFYAYVLAGLQRRKGKWPAVAEATGISLSTIKKIGRQEVKDPGVSLVERLYHHFRKEDQGESTEGATAPPPPAPLASIPPN